MILNRQKRVRLAARPLREFLRKVQRELRIPHCEITVAFVTDKDIARWNALYRNKDGPTDVLSFPAMAGPQRRRSEAKNAKRERTILGDIAIAPQTAKRERQILGDVAIAPQTAKRYAKKNGRTLPNELRVLMLHGILHLMGYDHEGDGGQMNRMEQKLRRRLGIG